MVELLNEYLQEYTVTAAYATSFLQLNIQVGAKEALLTLLTFNFQLCC